MPNWCTTNYRVVGNANEIRNLYALMKNIEERPTSLLPNDFGKRWFGNLVTVLGRDWHKVRCRGEWYDLELIDRHTIGFEAMSAWYELSEVRKMLQEHFPSLRIYFIATEPGCGIYETNDKEGRFFKAVTVVETEDEISECVTEEEAIVDIEEIIGRKLEKDEDPATALGDWGDRYRQYTNYYTYKIID